MADPPDRSDRPDHATSADRADRSEGGSSDPSTDVFELVSDPTRLAVLRELVDAVYETPREPWVSYSDLRDRVGAPDKGNFNYHLGRLDGLVENGSDGYAVTPVGRAVVVAVAAGVFDEDWTWGPVDVPGECRFCGDSLRLRYTDGRLGLGCGDADHELLLPSSPSLVAGCSGEEALSRVGLVMAQEAELVREGVCPDCEGQVDGEIRRHETDPDAHGYHFAAECDRCGFLGGYTVGALVRRLPVTTAFLHERGADLGSTPFWTVDFCRPGHEVVVGERPLRLRIDVEREGETLSVTLNREGSVVEVDEP
ncbi:winged helix-turn-helix domain-containing protein [Halobium salinum]|uniref:Winged helix-turn-helix domain-containing protein n=1 Tax=Halobium salinum TaxID=1364940 RepID=A0ABD5P9D4_9EURY|nr:helix-turn-helix domain-containing protein [Halobium salinum]